MERVDEVKLETLESHVAEAVTGYRERGGAAASEALLLPISASGIYKYPAFQPHNHRHHHQPVIINDLPSGIPFSRC
jgi:hypothetical protein